jgi:hypothetical protein
MSRFAAVLFLVAGHHSQVLGMRNSEGVAQSSVSVKAEGRGITRWKKDFCISSDDFEFGWFRWTSDTSTNCKTFIKEQEANCTLWHEKKNSTSKVEKLTAFYDVGMKCKNFLEKKLESQQNVATKGKAILKGYVKDCETDVLAACKQYGGPVWKKSIQSEENSDEACEQVMLSAFQTGVLECNKDKETWEECQAKHVKALIDAGRIPALEALVREHFVKCVCVKRNPSEEGICYQGSLGLKPGEKWCEWHDTPSWRPLLEKFPAGEKIPTATC